jgi:hypothetical protein
MDLLSPQAPSWRVEGLLFYDVIEPMSVTLHWTSEAFLRCGKIKMIM